MSTKSAQSRRGAAQDEELSAASVDVSVCVCWTCVGGLYKIRGRCCYQSLSLPRALAARLPSASGVSESHVPKKARRPTLAPGSASTAARSSARASSASSPG